MRQLPLDIGPIHFVGIGGIGMSGIAEIMHNLGYQVQGSDLAANANVERLRGLGIAVSQGHKPDHLGAAKVVVVSSAVGADNPEIRAARARLVPVVRRAEMLAELMRLRWSVAVAGTHGKTTTTSMIAAVLDSARYDPTVINGGIINAYGTNARLGAGEWMVVEADESDGTFVKLPATIAVVTNIDPEHLDHYRDFEHERAAFQTFVENIPFYGFAALCIDHPEVQAMIGRISDRRLVTYGLGPQADVRGVDVAISAEGASFGVQFTDRVRSRSRRFDDLRMPMPGTHNVLNALAAVAVADEMGIGEARIREAFAGFGGVRRRFTRTGLAAGITVVDDYAHHPVEIAAVLDAARTAYRGRVVAVVQPHRFTRLRDLFEEFLHLLQRRRRGRRRRRLPRRGGADRGHRPRRADRRAAPPRPSPGGGAAVAGTARGDGLRPCRGRRSGDLPGRREHHELGRLAALGNRVPRRRTRRRRRGRRRAVGPGRSVVTAAPAPCGDLLGRLPAVRGRYKRQRRPRPHRLVPRRRPSRNLVPAARCRRSGRVPAGAPRRPAGDRDRGGVQPADPRRRHRRRGRAAGPRLRRHRARPRRTAHTLRRGRARCQRRRGGPAPRASPGSSS